MSKSGGAATPAPGLEKDARKPAAEEAIVGIVRFRMDPRRRPRTAALAEEELLWRRLERRLGDGEASRMDPAAFTGWWRSAEREA